MTSNYVRPRALAVFLFAAFIVGCVTSQVVAPLLVPPVRAGTNPIRWEYLCTEIHNRMGSWPDTRRLQTLANTAGAEGWELVAAAGAGWGQNSFGEMTHTWCFKRPLP
jgi:hypothetical protein